MKKVTLILTALLLMSTLLTACASDSGNTADTTASVDTTAADTNAEVTEPAEYTAPGVTFDGRTVTFLDYITDDYFWHAATYSDIFCDDENGDPVNDAQYKRNQKVEEELDIKLAIHSVGNVGRLTSGPEFRRLVMAGENLIDVGFMFTGEMRSILSEPSMTIDFNEISTMDLDASWWDQNFIDEFTLYGKLSALTGDISLFSNFAPIMLFYSKQLAENYDLGDFYDMVMSRTWTSDKMIEMCKKVAHDVNGDGKMDVEDCYGMALQNGLLISMFLSSGQHLVDNTGEEIIPVVNNERTINIIERFSPFIDNTNVNNNVKVFASRFKNVYYEHHIPTFKDNRILFNYNQLLIMFELRAMETDFGVLPWPLFDEAQENYASDISTSWATAMMIPATQGDLDLIGHVLDSLGYYSQQYVTPAFIDTTVMDKAIRDDESAEMLEIILNSRTYDIGHFYGWGGISSMINTLASSGSTDFASQYASVEAKFISDIDAAMEQLRG